MTGSVSSTKFAEKTFTIEATQEAVWHLIGGVILQSMPGMERIEVIDENNFTAVLKVKVSFIVVNMYLIGEFVDLTPPKYLGVRLKGKSLGGMLQLNQMVSIALATVDEGKTEVVCKATMEGVGTLMRMFLLWQARRTAGDIFKGIETRLKQLV